MTTHALTPVRFATDDDLVARVRSAADTAAASELWVRYHPFGVNAAHVVRGRSDDAEFVAAEAFTALLGSLGHGADVDDPFSLLLARRVSHAAAAPADAVARDDILDDPAAFDDPDAPGREPRADALEQSVLREAFATLPDDSRATMWHEVADRPGDGHGLGTPVAATRRAVARVRDDLRARYVATLVSRDAVVPACRSYVTELPALVAGRETSSEVIVHAAGCHRCSSRVEQLRELEYAVPSAVLPLLAPLTSGSTLPLLGPLPVVEGAQLDIVPHAPSARAIPPQQAARWMVGAGLAASVLAAAAAISWTTPTTDKSVAGSNSTATSDRDTITPEIPRSTGEPSTGITPPDVGPGSTAPPVIPPVTEPPTTTDPGEPDEPITDDGPGTGGSPGPRGGSSPDPTSPTRTPDRPTTPAVPTDPTSPSAPAVPPVEVEVAVVTEKGKGTAEVRAAVAPGATKFEVTIDPPKKVKADKDAGAGDLECTKQGGGTVVCTGAPAADGMIAADVQLDWPEGITGKVMVTVKVLEGADEGRSGTGSGSPDPVRPTSGDPDRTPSTDTSPPATEDTRPGDAVVGEVLPEISSVLDEVRAIVGNDLTPVEVRAEAEALLAELLAAVGPTGN
ncbi:MAG: RNA polymerase sigma factor [Phycicoccus sp.]